jgi:hypothetical protein
MKVIPVKSLKANVVFRQGELPAIDPARPTFTLQLGQQQIAVAVNPKAARKLASHAGGAVLSGRLVSEGGALKLLEGGFQFLDRKEESVEQPAAKLHPWRNPPP